MALVRGKRTSERRRDRRIARRKGALQVLQQDGMSGGEPVGQILGYAARRLAFRFEAAMHSKKVKRQDEKAPFERVGNAKRLIENGKPRPRHNRAIEFRGVRI